MSSHFVWYWRTVSVAEPATSLRSVRSRKPSLLHQWDALAGTREFKGTEIIGYDEANGGYFTRFFDNAGFHPEYTATVDGAAWKFVEPSTRATLTVREDGEQIEHVWEWFQDGEWLPLCERTATRR